jgi:hypothetical protein
MFVRLKLEETRKGWWRQFSNGVTTAVLSRLTTPSPRVGCGVVLFGCASLARTAASSRGFISMI